MPSLGPVLKAARERRLIKTAAIYFSTGMTSLGVLDLITRHYGLTTKAFDTLLILLICGFPAALLAAWHHAGRPARRLVRTERIVDSILLLLALVLVYRVLGRPAFLPSPVEAKSIAVLPFRNMNDSRDDEIFSDGVTEDILTQLSKIADLKVISRTSVMPYKNSPKSVRRIGKELGVAVILEGSVRREKDRVRIGGQLIDARNEKLLWAETFDRQMTDIFSIQSEVAQKIAAALKATLSAGEKTRIEKPATDNVEAYAYYVRGREYYYHYTREDNEKAVEFFRKALDLDPNYALAYAGLADAFVRRWIYEQADGVKAGDAGIRQGRDPIDLALEYSRKAVDLDPASAEAYKALGFAEESKGLAAESMNSYLKAVELNPNYAPAITNIGVAKMDAGRFDEALIWLRKAVRLQPGSARYYALPALQYYNLGFDGLAETWFRKALDFQPDYLFPQFILGYIELLDGRSGAAEARIDKILRDRPADANALEEAGDIRLLGERWKEAAAFYEKLGPITGLANPAGNKLAFALSRLGRKAEADMLLAANLAAFLQSPRIEVEGSPVAYMIAQVNALKKLHQGRSRLARKIGPPRLRRPMDRRRPGLGKAAVRAGVPGHHGPDPGQDRGHEEARPGRRARPIIASERQVPMKNQVRIAPVRDRLCPMRFGGRRARPESGASAGNRAPSAAPRRRERRPSPHGPRPRLQEPGSDLGRGHSRSETAWSAPWSGAKTEGSACRSTGPTSGTSGPWKT